MKPTDISSQLELWNAARRCKWRTFASDQGAVVRFLDFILKICKLVLILCLGFLLFMVAVTVLHVNLQVCPFHFAHFERSQIREVLYGLPSEETFERAARGEVVLGGCMPGSIAAVCPYCIWPARFCYWEDPAAVPLNETTLKELSAEERREAQRYAKHIAAQTQTDMDECVTAVLVTPTDVWLGSLWSGLHRFERKTKVWHSYDEKGAINGCVRRIWRDGSRIFVEHASAMRTLYVESFTDDRGKTWHCF
jgi:hypothetical protein